MSIHIPQPANSLTVIPVQLPEDPGAESRALLSVSNSQISVKGPAVLLRVGFEKLGGVFEGLATRGARAMRLGPECAAEDVISFLGTGESCVGKLDELYHWQQGSKTTSKPHHSNPSPPGSVKKLRKLCKSLTEYTHGYVSFVSLSTSHIDGCPLAKTPSPDSTFGIQEHCDAHDSLHWP